VALAFRNWLLFQEASLVDRAVLDSYERAFRQGLDALIARTKHPELRKTFEGMRNCPVHDGSGACRTWTDYLLAALIRHGCHHNADVDEVLQHVVFSMLSGVGERGQHRKALFDFDETQPFDLRVGNPLEVLFKTYLRHGLANLCSDRLRRVRNVDRPAGTLTIGQGRGRDDPTTGFVNADAIPDKSDRQEEELFGDISDVLRRKSTRSMPLAALWQAMLAGMPLKKQRQVFGHGRADTMRKTIKTTLWDYATTTGNHELLRLLDTKPAKRPKRERSAPKLKLPPDVQDYLSIIDVIERAGGAASMAVLGKKRRRWLERKPRNPNSPHKTRLHDVLGNMLSLEILQKDGPRYRLGRNANQFKANAAQVAH